MFTTKTITLEHEVAEDIFCNRCGKNCVTQRSEDGSILSTECAVLNADWGYDSNKDTSRTFAHLCENCVDEIEKDFMHPATKYDE